MLKHARGASARLPAQWQHAACYGLCSGYLLGSGIWYCCLCVLCCLPGIILVDGRSRSLLIVAEVWVAAVACAWYRCYCGQVVLRMLGNWLLAADAWVHWLISGCKNLLLDMQRYLLHDLRSMQIIILSVD